VTGDFVDPLRPFNPFEKPLHDLNASDLRRRREIPEGWYIEYKGNFPGVASAAKSLSAFANSSGGWVFYGIREDKQTRTAEDFVGIPADSVPQAEEWLRQAATDSVSPSPYFEHIVLSGPSPEIGLAEGRAIIVANVPRGNNSPYLHQSGRIYRRIGDSSDPIHETDRHSLDILWHRSQKRRAEFEKLVTEERRLSEPEQSATYITLYFFPDPWDSRALHSRIEFEDFARLMKDDRVGTGQVPFDNVFTASDAYIARQVRNNNPYFQVFTWKYHRNCISEITIPMPSVRIGSDDFKRFLQGYNFSAPFIERCSSIGLHDGWVLDLSQSFFILSSIMVRLHRLFEMEGLSWPVYMKARIADTWRRVPFLDIPDYVSFLSDFGVPMVQQRECYAPYGTDPDSCFRLHDVFIEDVEDPEQRCMIARSVDACFVLFQIAEALGLHHSATGYDFRRTEENGWLTKMTEMGDRAIAVMRSRNTSLRRPI
jgi:Putative DNA-binding domain